MKPFTVPVLRPRLPGVAEILPWLKEIEERRWYSNQGPLVTELEERLGQRFGAHIVCTANATVGITAALLARRVPPGSFCVMPSWTFAATPHAARAAGLVPWFHDVNPATWALDPEHLRGTLPRLPGPAGAVIAVSPFGAPLDGGAWQRFEEQTGVPVVIDGAAAFDTIRPGHGPAVVSLHATKVLGAGEGGFIASSSLRLIETARSCCNFGFQGTREAMLPALNGKMSEYHAAVALAALEDWPRVRSQHRLIVSLYQQRIAAMEGISLQPGYGADWVSATTNVLLPPGTLARVARQLDDWGIETRQWWGQGCHAQSVFKECLRGPLPVTQDLGGRVLGLPHFPDMQESQVKLVCEALRETLRGLVKRIA